MSQNPRSASQSRKTAETDVHLNLDLDGSGISKIVSDKRKDTEAHHELFTNGGQTQMRSDFKVDDVKDIHEHHHKWAPELKGKDPTAH